MREELTPKQKGFADYYIECGNATEAAKRAGYSEKYLNTHASKMLQNATISAYIAERVRPDEENRIATGKEVMEFFTAVMRGEIKDAFDLPPSLADRKDAAKELAKRTVDINGDKDEYESDGFIEALKGQVEETFKKAGEIVET